MADPSPTLSLNRNARFEFRRVGREGHPLLIIDNVLEVPEALTTQARSADFMRPTTFYPGLNAPLPNDYTRRVVEALRPILQRTFGIPAHLSLSVFGFFALASDEVSALLPIQKIPHHDSVDPFMIASVHYLCHRDTGGTAFFRHKATGFESVDAKRISTYARQVEDELERVGKDLTHYSDSNTPGFELIETAEIVFNRMILYRSHVLHSGLMTGELPSSDPETGRLTANTFISVQKATE